MRTTEEITKKIEEFQSIIDENDKSIPYDTDEMIAVNEHTKFFKEGIDLLKWVLDQNNNE